MSIASQLTAISAQITALGSSSGGGNNAPVLAAIANLATLIGDAGSTGGTSTLASVSVSPTSVVGPANSTGTVTLSAVSTTDSLVTLSSDNAAAVVPANVTIPAGSTSATFQITTLAVSSSINATLTASFAGVNQTAQLAVTQ